MNARQVRLSKKLHSTRRLSYQGEKLAILSVKCQNAITHSYTVQPKINIAGEVVKADLFMSAGRISESELDYICYHL